MNYNDNGTIKQITVKAGDTLPIGTEVDVPDGTTIPAGWEEVSELNEVLYTNYLSINNGITINTAKAIKYGKIVAITLDITGTFNRGETVLGSCTDLLAINMHGAGRFTTNSYLNIPCDIIAIKNGALRVYSTEAGTQISTTILFIVTD